MPPPAAPPRPALLEEAPSARRAAPRTAQAPGKSSSASPWGTKAPRPEPRRLTDGREEEPSLVDGRDPLLLIVADGDLDGVGAAHGEGENRSHRSQAGRPAGTTSQSVKPIGSNQMNPLLQEVLLAWWALSEHPTRQGAPLSQRASRVSSATCPLVRPAAGPHFYQGVYLAPTRQRWSLGCPHWTTPSAVTDRGHT